MMTRLAFFIFAILLACQTHATDRDGKRIGLVLSGGAARGLSHIGVIKALEQQGIYVDAVAGTSMGAIVGGMYASGYSVQQLEQVATTLDWNYALADTPPRRDLTFRRKEEDRLNLLNAKLTIAGSEVSLPKGVLDGQNLGLVLQDIFQHTNDQHDFDQLSIPFHAVATDLESGNAVVLSKGSLPFAIRASMSIPGLLAPVHYEGRVLADGGMANNMPVDVARAMGVDRVIAVNISTPLQQKEDLNSILSVSEQVTTFLTIKGTEQQKRTLTERDILLEPDLSSLGSLDFSAADKAIALGYEATMAQADKLRSFQSPKPQNRQPLVVEKAPLISGITLQNSSYLYDETILAYIRQPKGKAFDRELLIHNINTLYGLDYFLTINYQLLDDGKGGKRLHLIVNGDRRHMSFIRFGFSTSDDFRGNNYYNLASSYNVSGITQYGAEWYNYAQIGNTTRLHTEFFLPLGFETPFYLRPQLNYTARDIPIYDDQVNEQRLVIRDRKTQAGIKTGYMFSQFTDFSMGAYYADGKLNLKTGEALVDNLHYRQGFVSASFRLDSENNVYFPTEGARAEFNYRHYDERLGSDTNYYEYDGLGSYAYSFGRNTLILRAQTAHTNGQNVVPSNHFLLGGLGHLSGFSEASLVTQNNNLASVHFTRLLNEPLLVFNTRYYLLASVEYGRAWNSADSDIAFDTGYITAGSLGFGMDSPLGPVVFAYGHNSANHHALYFTIGQTF